MSREQPLREGWLSKQSGGAIQKGRRRRASVGELVKKWDERYAVLTTMRLYYFKSDSDFKSGQEPKGVVELHDSVIEYDAEIDSLQFRLRESRRIYNFKADDSGVATRWVTALRTVQLAGMASNWDTEQLLGYLELATFPESIQGWVRTKEMKGFDFAMLRDNEHLTSLGYPDAAPRDQVWELLTDVRRPEVHDWLTRYSAFVAKNKQVRALEEAELKCFARMEKAMQVTTMVFADKADTDADAAAAPGTADADAEDQMQQLAAGFESALGGVAVCEDDV